MNNSYRSCCNADWFLFPAPGPTDQAPCGVGSQVLVMMCAADRVPVPSRNKCSHFAGSARLMAVECCATLSPALCRASAGARCHWVKCHGQGW
jgi:hypothetical protein